MSKKYVFFVLIFMISACLTYGAGGQLMNLHGAPSSARFTVTDKTWPATHGEAEICLWKDDAHAAVSFTIDDNNVPDHTWWISTCQSYDFEVTWFVITSLVTNNPGFSGPWSAFENVHSYGHDVESHTVTHLSFDRGFDPNDPAHDVKHEYTQSIIDIENNVSNMMVRSLAYPGGANSSYNDDDLAAQYYNACRGTVGTPNQANKINYTRTSSISGAFYIDQLTGGASWNSFEDTIMNSGNNSYRGWYCMHYHGLSDGSKSNITAGLDYLLEKDDEVGIWIGKFSEVAQYGQERDTAALSVTSVSDSEVQFSISDDMHDSYFTFPLTVKVRVDGWHSAVAVQNGEEVPVSIITNAAVTYALVDAVPDLGTVTLTEAAAAAFSATPQSGWTPLTVTFTDTETGTVSRVWDFGDGATSNTTAQAVEHTYVAAGVYSVELVSGGVTNTRVDYITVTAPVAPTAGFSASPLSGAIPLSVAFTDTSTGDITNRVWTFGDGASETTSATSVYHTYTNAGTYDVSLIARGPSGADTNTQAGVITATAPVPPTAIFNAAPLSGSIPLTVNFTDDSTGSIADRVWDFGDGTTTNTTDLYMSHTYTSAGTYSVQLVVNGPAGAHTNTQTDLITATNPPPPANVIQVAGDPADRSIGSSSNGVLLLLSTTATLPRIADDNFSNNQGACTVVLVFRLPDLEGQRVVSADLSTWFEASWIQSAGALPNDPADNVLPKWVDLYGVRWSTGSTVLTNDYGYKTVGTANGIRLQEQFLYQSTHENMGGNPVEAVTDELGAANLAAWMQAQYDDGAQPGDYVFLRLHAAFASAGFFGVYSAENADTAKRPVLTLGLGTAGGSTPPPPTAVFGSASLGRGLDVINWTPVQGSGFVYSVWFSTNLMEGFQPLETNLPDTVQSLTNAIQAPSVFYKIDVQ